MHVLAHLVAEATGDLDQLDAAVLALIWLLAEAIAGIPPAVPSWRRMRRSFRVRVAVALAAFFLIFLPALRALSILRRTAIPFFANAMRLSASAGLSNPYIASNSRPLAPPI